MTIYQLELPYGIRPVNPVHLDLRYGPYADVALACTSVPLGIRVLNLTVGIENGSVIDEYWWYNGIDDVDLILKTTLPPYQVFIVGPSWDNKFTIPVACVLEKIIVVPFADATPSANVVGGTAGDIVPAGDIVTPAGVLWLVNLFTMTSVEIEVIDLPDDSYVVFFLQQIIGLT